MPLVKVTQVFILIWVRYFEAEIKISDILQVILDAVSFCSIIFMHAIARRKNAL